MLSTLPAITASPLPLPLPVPILMKALAVLSAGFALHTFNAPPHGMGHKKQAETEQVLGEPMKIELPVRVLVPIFKVRIAYRRINGTFVL